MNNFLRTIYILFVSLIFLAACSEYVSNSDTTDKFTDNVEQVAYLLFSVEYDKDSRTLIPTAVTAADVTKAVLTAQSTENAGYVKTFEWASLTAMKGDSSKVLATGTYNFTLELFTGAQGTVRSQTASIQKQIIKSGKNSLTFKCTYDAQSTGTLSVTLNFAQEARVEYAKACILQSDGTTVLEGFDLESVAIVQHSASYTKSNIPVGTYYVKFLLYNAQSEVVYTFFDVAYIQAGCITAKTDVLSTVNTVYTITYHMNGGTFTDGYTAPTRFNQNTAVILPTYANCTKYDMVLYGWYTDSDFTGEPVAVIPTGTSNDVVLYALYGYKINYVSKGAAVENQNALVYFPKVGYEFVEATRTYMDFEGWYTEESFEHKITKIEKGNTGEVTVYAKWTVTPSNLENATRYNRSEPEVFYVCGEDETLSGCGYPYATYTYGLDLSGMPNLTSVKASNSKITSIVLPMSVTSIGDSAFYGCTGLASIELPAGLTSIGASAFSGCTGLTSIELSDSLTSIGQSAFSGCIGLTSIEFPNSLTSIGDFAFNYCPGLTSIELPDRLTSIGRYAFHNCYGLTSIELPDSLTNIGDNAFYSCTGLTSIELPDSIENINEYTFCYCTALTNIKLPNAVGAIHSAAFFSCTKLNSIQFMGTKAEWEKIFFGTSWNYNIPAKTVSCSDGEVKI